MPQLRCGRVSFAGRRFNVAHRILLTGIASQAAACKQSLRILLAEWTCSERALFLLSELITGVASIYLRGIQDRTGGGLTGSCGFSGKPRPGGAPRRCDWR